MLKIIKLGYRRRESFKRQIEFYLREDNMKKNAPKRDNLSITILMGLDQGLTDEQILLKLKRHGISCYKEQDIVRKIEETREKYEKEKYERDLD